MDLMDFAVTEIQREVVERRQNGESWRSIGRAMGIVDTSARSYYDRIKKRAARQGWSPEHDMTRTVPDGYIVKGTSTYYNDEGKPTGQWVKSSIDHDRQQALMQAAYEALAEQIPKAKPTKPPTKPTNPDILNCYVITDYHLGSLSWADETGADWDVGIAEQALVNWFTEAIRQAPQSEQAIFAQLSDFLHWDGFDAVTPMSKNLLDADTRFPKLVRIAIRVIRRVIDLLLSKHPRVHVIMADANHDPVSQVWLREWLAVLYADEPRITVDTTPSPYNAYEFGSTALFFHHGHKRKVVEVSKVFAGKFKEIYGRTKHAYAHTGHLHHHHAVEDQLMIVEQHRTLTAPDAYSARGGWLSGRDAKVITYHKDYGEVGRIVVSYDMIRPESDKS